MAIQTKASEKKHSEMLNKISDIIKNYSGKEGCFVPYIGSKYTEGIEIKNKLYKSQGYKETSKILVIGARHYCDARYDSRNLLARINEKDLNTTCDSTEKEGKTPYFKNDWKFGCTKQTPATCLSKEWMQHNINTESGCPVFEGKKCQLSDSETWAEKCWYKKFVECEKKYCRLECETIYAAVVASRATNSNLKEKPEIKSQKHGKEYFDAITSFIRREFNISPEDRHTTILWDCISYMNLIQRYIPYASNNTLNLNDKIQKYIKSEDINFCQEIIRQLKPDFIITTMKCVKDKINEMEEDKKKDYSLIRDPNPMFSIFRKCVDFDSNHNVSPSPVWKNKIIQAIEKYDVPLKDKQFTSDIKGLIEYIKQDESGLGEPKILKVIYEELLKNINKGLKEEKYKSTNRNKGPWEKAAFKMRDEYNKGLTEFSNWLRHNKQKPDVNKWQNYFESSLD